MHLLALGIIGFTIFLIVRKYQTQATLFLSGFALLLLAYGYSLWTDYRVPGLEESPTGWVGFDFFAIIRESFSTRTAGIGMIIMAAGGFARYMSSIAASTALVKLAVKPLSRIRNPYIVLGLAYVIGQILNIFVPSAAGLAMLLLVAMYPTLVKLGLRPVSVAAVIGTTACLDLGPASPASNVAATVSGLEPVVYFARYQIPVALVVIPVVAILHVFWQRHCDRLSPPGEDEVLANPLQDKAEGPTVPLVYALLPVLPLVLLLLFSPIVVKSIQIDVVTAMLISLFVSLACECLRLRSVKAALAGIVEFFQGMGELFAKVVTLIVAAEFFATGVKATGLIERVLHLTDTAGLGPAVMMLFLVLLIGFTAMLTGSGNAALFSFGNMVPGITQTLGVNTAGMMLPTQLSAGMFRSMSPVAGVIIAVSSAANVSPFTLIRRTAVPMLGGVVAMVGVSALLL